MQLLGNKGDEKKTERKKIPPRFSHSKKNKQKVCKELRKGKGRASFRVQSP